MSAAPFACPARRLRDRGDDADLLEQEPDDLALFAELVEQRGEQAAFLAAGMRQTQPLDDVDRGVRADQVLAEVGGQGGAPWRRTPPFRCADRSRAYVTAATPSPTRTAAPNTPTARFPSERTRRVD